MRDDEDRQGGEQRDDGGQSPTSAVQLAGRRLTSRLSVARRQDPSIIDWQRRALLVREAEAFTVEAPTRRCLAVLLLVLVKRRADLGDEQRFSYSRLPDSSPFHRAAFHPLHFVDLDEELFEPSEMPNRYIDSELTAALLDSDTGAS